MTAKELNAIFAVINSAMWADAEDMLTVDDDDHYHVGTLLDAIIPHVNSVNQPEIHDKFEHTARRFSSIVEPAGK